MAYLVHIVIGVGMTRSQFTGLIKAKGWKVKDALSYWGRSVDWYHDNTHGDTKARIRLECMIYGLPDRDDVKL